VVSPGGIRLTLLRRAPAKRGSVQRRTASV